MDKIKKFLGQQLLLMHVWYWVVNLLALDRFIIVSVGAIIENEKGELLLVKRSDKTGFCLPGGQVLSCEDFEDALVREVAEETGYQIEINGLFAYNDDPKRDRRFRSVIMVFLATIINGERRPSYEGNPQWIAKQALPTNMAFDNAWVLDAYLGGSIRKDLPQKTLQNKALIKKQPFSSPPKGVAAGVLGT